MGFVKRHGLLGKGTAVQADWQQGVRWFAVVVALGLTATSARTATASENPAIQCVIPLNAASSTNTGVVWKLHDLPGGRVMIAAENGLFQVREVNGEVSVTHTGPTDTGFVQEFHDLPGTGALIRATKGLFQAREVNGEISVSGAGPAHVENVEDFHDLPGAGVLIRTWGGLFQARAVNGEISVSGTGPSATGSVWHLHDLPGAGVLIWADNGLFQARAVNGKATITSAGPVDFGNVIDFHDLPGAGVLIGTDNGLFQARALGDKVKITRAGPADMGVVQRFYDLPGAGVLIWVDNEGDNGWFQARAVDGKVAVTDAGPIDTGEPTRFYNLPGPGALIRADNGLFQTREVDGKVTITSADPVDMGALRDFRDLRGAGVLIAAENGLFQALTVDGNVTITRAGAVHTGEVWYLHDLPAGGMLISADLGLFQARAADGKVTITSIGPADVGGVRAFHDLPGGEVLIGADNGLFQTREVDGKVTATSVGPADTGQVLDFHNLSGAVLIRGDKGFFLGPTTPLTLSLVDFPDRGTLDKSSIDPKRDLPIKLSVAHHLCAAGADKLDLKIRVTGPDGKSIDKNPSLSFSKPSIVDVSIQHRIDKAGEWAFQVISTYGGMERQVGKAQYLSFVSPDAPPWWQGWGPWLAKVLPVLLVLANLALFGLARRSPWAWRIATDDGWGTKVLRIATFLLSYFTKLQLWILDLYFGRLRAQVPKPARPFMPLPLTGSDGSLQPSEKVTSPPWSGRRVWVQGGSGMGKTALFRNITEAHFRGHDTAFAAFAEWGCIVVAFAARDFASSGEDKDDPAWVFDAVRTTLSSQGLTFGSNSLLSRFLENGTIGVMIDGLNEVNRTKAVAAFNKRFSDAPMLVTSQQQPGDDRFTTWSLPLDIRIYVKGLLRLYLPAQAEGVMETITASGLKDAIRSGYDVLLIIDLVRVGAELPVDRLGLYAEVISKGWPTGSDETQHEQQSRLAAAAWRMVSERKPNEDMRRLRPEVDLAPDLLEALAAAPEKDTRPVHLLRRVGGTAFEFVHDQMHFYMAARWFAQDGFSADELEKMAASSTIWMHAPEARHTLWDFAAALLDDNRLMALWSRIDDKEAYDSLRRSLKAEARRRKLAALTSENTSL